MSTVSTRPPSLTPLAVETVDGCTYIDAGEVQISIDGEGEVLITCPPELLTLAAACWADPRVQAAVARVRRVRTAIAA